MKETAKAVLIVLGFAAFCGGVLFGSAGRVDLPFVWAEIILIVTYMLVTVRLIDPELRKERVSPGEGGISRNFRLAVLPIILAGWIIAGLDVGRFHWSDTVPAWLQMSALAGLALSLALATWALTSNRFFSPVVRVQSERGHHVVTDGPYRFVRHPGYLATVLGCVFGILALGSWIAMLTVVPYVMLFAHRTLVEERFLREHLTGYSDYAARVRSRWVPGIW